MPLLPTNPIERLVWAVLILVIVAYVAGAWLNRRRSRAISRWLQDGLGRLGKQANWQRVGASGGQVTIADATRPFRRVVIGFYLLTREFAPLWAVERMQGKRDLLALRGELRVEPAEEIEVVPRNGKLRSLVDARAGQRPWIWHEAPAGLEIGLRAAADGIGPAPSLVRFVERHGQRVQRLSIRPRKPHVMLFLSVTELEGERALELFRDLQDVVSA